LNALREPLAAQLDRVPADWRPVVDAWRASPQGQALIAHVDARVAEGATVYPTQVLRALELTPLASVRVVILGQDPYHGAGQAHGLAFSVPAGVKLPPSLRNIYAELVRDLAGAPASGDLTHWAEQGVLLLNTSLTVEDGQPASHAKRGWEALTESLLRAVASRGRPCAYLLWGAHAQRLQPLIEAATPKGAASRVLAANHPSPLSARRPPVPFLGCSHFSEVNRFLTAQGEPPIAWVG
jgi:uracil-DNA glycosylase